MDVEYLITEAINMITGGIAFLGGAALTLVGAYTHKIALWVGGLGTVVLGLIILGLGIVLP